MAIQTIRDGATNLCLDGCPRAAVSLFSYKPFDGAIDCRAHDQCDKSGGPGQARAD